MKFLLLLTVLALALLTAVLFIQETSLKPTPGDLRVELCHEHPAHNNSPMHVNLPTLHYTADDEHYVVTLDTIRGSTDCGRLADQSIPTAEGTNFTVLQFEIDGLEAPSSDVQFPSGDRLTLYPFQYSKDGRWVQSKPYQVFPNEINGEHGRVFIINQQGKLVLN